MKLVLICILSLLTAGSSVRAGDTVLLTNGEWPPYLSRSLPGHGCMSQIVVEAFKAEGMTVAFTFFDSWKRAYVTTVKGMYEGSVGWTPCPEKDQEVLFSDPVFFHENVLFHLKERSLAWERLEDLAGLRIGVTRGYYYGLVFDTALKKGCINKYGAYTDSQLLHNLVNRRIDAAVMDRRAGYHLLVSTVPAGARCQVTHHARSLERIPVCLVVSKNIGRHRADRLIQAFNAGLKQLKRSGRYKSIIPRDLAGP